MDLNEYQRAARRTSKVTDSNADLANMSMGLAGEAGEVVDLLKKHIFHGHDLDQTKLAYELGDVLWYVATLAHLCGIPLAEVARLNMLKLEKRYPNGFTTEASIEREDEK